MFINKKIELIIFVYVNDLLIIDFKNFTQIIKLKINFDKRFKIIDIKSCYHYLNMSIIRDRTNKFLHMSQKLYVDKILKRFNMTNCKIAFILMNFETKLKFNQKQINVANVKMYQIMINNLIYLFYCTRFDIEYNVQCFFRFNMNLFSKIFEIIKKMFRYFKDIKKTSIIYEFRDEFENYIDANYVDDISTRHFIDAYLFLLYENTIN